MLPVVAGARRCAPLRACTRAPTRPAVSPAFAPAAVASWPVDGPGPGSALSRERACPGACASLAGVPPGEPAPVAAAFLLGDRAGLVGGVSSAGAGLAGCAGFIAVLPPAGLRPPRPRGPARA